jgi:hypothetical protein
LERKLGIAPRSPAWHAGILLLDDFRKCSFISRALILSVS